MSYNVNPLAYKGVVHAQWLDDERFWYRAVDDSGVTYMSSIRLKERALRPSIRASLQQRWTRPRMAISRTMRGISSSISTRFKQGNGDGARTLLTRTSPIVASSPRRTIPASASLLRKESKPQAPAKQPPLTLSPDKKLGAFIRDWNLWVRDMATGAETQLTTDGVKDYGYATDNAGWKQSDAAILLWSPDSKKIATFQQDQRKTGEMYLVPVTNGHPTLKAWKYPLVGDKNVTMIERVIIDVDTRKVVRLKMPPDQHRSTLCDDVTCRGTGSVWDDVEWAPTTPISPSSPPPATTSRSGSALPTPRPAMSAK